VQKIPQSEASAKGGQEVLISYSPKDLEVLRSARAQLYLARRQYEQYQQLGLIAIDERLALAMLYFIDHADGIMRTCLDE